MFKDDLAKVMKEDHMTKKELARYLGVTEGAVNHWLNGSCKPGERPFHMICELYELPIERYVKERSSHTETRQLNKFDFDGEKLRRMMDNKGMNQAMLAKRVGVGKSSPGNWLNGATPTMENLNKLAAIFHVSPDYFRKGVNEPFSPKPQVDPKVKERESKWKNPYKVADAPIISTPIVEVKDLTEEEIEDVKKMAEDMKSDGLSLLTISDADRIAELKEKLELMEFDYKLQDDHIHDRINALEKENKELHEALDGIRKLIIDLLKVRVPDTKAETKKGFWARLLG